MGTSETNKKKQSKESNENFTREEKEKMAKIFDLTLQELENADTYAIFVSSCFLIFLYNSILFADTFGRRKCISY